MISFSKEVIIMDFTILGALLLIVVVGMLALCFASYMIAWMKKEIQNEYYVKITMYVYYGFISISFIAAIILLII